MSSSCCVCKKADPNYSCPSCQLRYCSLVCHKEHRTTCQGTSLQKTVEAPTSLPPKQAEDEPLKPLSSLKWPFILEAPSFQDPLGENDPQPLKLSQFEAIATSRGVRDILASDRHLPDLLRNLDNMSPRERDAQMKSLLGLGDTGQLDPDKLTETEKENSESFSAFVAAIQDTIANKDGERSDGLQWA